MANIPTPDDLLTIAGQIMLLVGIAGLLMQIGRWLQKRNIPTERAHFVVVVGVVVMMGATTIVLFTIQTDSIHELESEILANQKLTHQLINTTHQNQAIEQDILRQLHYHIVVQTTRNQTDEGKLLTELQALLHRHTNSSLP